MRKKLQKLDQQRLRFRAKVEKFSTKNGYQGSIEDTILLKNICLVETGEEVADHVWFTVGKTIEELDLSPGDVIEFDARVDNYTKGYVNYRQGIDDRKIDYKLSRPTKFQKITEND